MTSATVVGLSRDTVLSPAIDIPPLVAAGGSWATDGKLGCLGEWLVGGVLCPGEDVEEDWEKGEAIGTDDFFCPI